MNPMARKIIMDKASRRDNARGYDITAYDKGYVSGYDEAYRKGYDRGMDEARRSSMDMANHHNVPMDSNYDNAYRQGYDKGYQDKAYEMLTPYGNTGMTVSGDGRQGVKGTGTLDLEAIDPQHIHGTCYGTTIKDSSVQMNCGFSVAAGADPIASDATNVFPKPVANTTIALCFSVVYAPTIPWIARS
jgi:hypothetical protein